MHRAPVFESSQFGFVKDASRRLGPHPRCGLIVFL
jgi:hypothetical protein